MAEGFNTLDELLSDPMVRLVMQRDSVRPEHLRLMLERARDRAQQPTLPPAHVIEKVCRAGRQCV